MAQPIPISLQQVHEQIHASNVDFPAPRLGASYEPVYQYIEDLSPVYSGLATYVNTTTSIDNVSDDSDNTINPSTMGSSNSATSDGSEGYDDTLNPDVEGSTEPSSDSER